MERITASAVKFKWYTKEEEIAKGNVWAPWHFVIVCGKTHGECYDKIKEMVGSLSEYCLKKNHIDIDLVQKFDEGFYTDNDRFVDRVEALRIARESGQVKPDQKLTCISGTPRLHSEDLYPELMEVEI